MKRIRLAEYQLRLLLCTPAAKQGRCLVWKCGCRAEECAYRKYAVTPCAAHALLEQVQEDEEPAYDWVSAPEPQNRRGRSA